MLLACQDHNDARSDLVPRFRPSSVLRIFVAATPPVKWCKFYVRSDSWLRYLS